MLANHFVYIRKLFSHIYIFSAPYKSVSCFFWCSSSISTWPFNRSSYQLINHLPRKDKRLNSRSSSLQCLHLEREARKRKREKDRERPWAGELKDLSGSREDDKSNICITEHWELFRLLKKPSSPLWKSHLPRRCVIDLPNLNLLSRHYRFLCISPQKTKQKRF